MYPTSLYDMVAGSILPVTIHKNKLYFLFGKENPLEDSAKGWSDFGGGVEAGETPYQTALREGGEVGVPQSFRPVA
jgi:8-oxo-dGTP pyrophosphatase MutT (NUDIX family)